MMDTMTKSQSDKPEESKSSSEELVDQFLDAIWMERGLSANTLGAYRADLMTLGRNLSERNIPIERAEKADLLEFIAGRVESGAKPRSTKYPILAEQVGTNRVYKFPARTVVYGLEQEAG